MKFKVTYEMRNKLGEWITDELTNNGKGFNFYDATAIAQQLRSSSLGPTRNVLIVKMEVSK